MEGEKAGWPNWVLSRRMWRETKSEDQRIRVWENTRLQNKGNVVSQGQQRINVGGAGGKCSSSSELSAEWLPFGEAQNKGAIQFHLQPTCKLQAQEASPSALPRFVLFPLPTEQLQFHSDVSIIPESVPTGLFEDSCRKHFSTVCNHCAGLS